MELKKTVNTNSTAFLNVWRLIRDFRGNLVIAVKIKIFPAQIFLDSFTAFIRSVMSKKLILSLHLPPIPSILRSFHFSVPSLKLAAHFNFISKEKICRTIGGVTQYLRRRYSTLIRSESKNHLLDAHASDI